MGFLTYFFSLYWKSLVIVFIPIITLPIFFLGDELKYKCEYIVANMAIYWITEVIPLGVTALVPIFTFPIFGILSTNDTCQEYFSDTVVMFFCGMVIALCIEYSNLHNRIALIIIMIFGCSPRRLHLGVTILTTFTSMWIANTPVCAMMCPIMMAILKEMEEHNIIKVYHEKENALGEIEKIPTNITLAYFLMAAYAASIGGIGTLVGTGTNLAFKGIYEQKFENIDEASLSFIMWSAFSIPLMVILTALNWFWFQYKLMGLFRPSSEDSKIIEKSEQVKEEVLAMIKTKYKELGAFTFHEIGTGILFVIAILLWVFRKPDFIKGWSYLIDKDNKKRITDSTSGILIVFLMFLVPAKLTFFDSFSTDPEKRPKKQSTGLITWTFLNKKMPWGFILLLGGGFALAKGGQQSGMSAHLGEILSYFGKLNKVLALTLIVTFTEIITEFTSNVAIANIVLPILIELSIQIKLHPLFFTMPAAVACSFAFMTAVGTPGNAVAAGYVNINSKQMASIGIGTKIISIICIVLIWINLGEIIYNMEEFPTWAKNSKNSTISRRSFYLFETDDLFFNYLD